MNVLKSVETTIANLVEGTFGRLFRSEVRPMELARKLAREMDENRTMSVSERYNRSSVGSSVANTGSWPARIPIEPEAVRVETISTSSSNTTPSGVRTSTGNLVLAMSPA